MGSTEDHRTPPPAGERRLIAAIILRAIEESQAGDVEAADWLATTGSDWCDQFLGLLVPPDAWARIDLKAARRRLAADPSEVAKRLERDRARWRLADQAARARRKQQRGAA